MRDMLAPIPCVVAALALAGCMGRTAPIAVAYAELAPARHDAAYHLDAGDRLRVVVYGQEGLTNTYAIDAGGSITMPLIGKSNPTARSLFSVKCRRPGSIPTFRT